MKILIADDHAVLRKGLVQILAEEFPDAHFGETANTPETLACLSRDRWDVLVLDIFMPGRTGLEVLLDVRQHQPDLPVLVLSSAPEEQLAVRVLKAGASGYLNKQTAAEELVRGYEPIIRSWVRVWLRRLDTRLRRVFDSLDVCQSVLASFFLRTAAGEYDISSTVQLVKLLVSMARNKLISAARREHMQRRDVRRRTSLGETGLQDVADRHQTPVDELANRELLTRIYDRMSAEELEISKLRGGGAAWEEVASTLGGTAQSRRMQFSRAIERVAGQLGLELA